MKKRIITSFICLIFFSVGTMADDLSSIRMHELENLIRIYGSVGENDKKKAQDLHTRAMEQHTKKNYPKSEELW